MKERTDMNCKTLVKMWTMPVLALAILAVTATPSFAQVNLVALEATATMPDATVIPMWGFFPDTEQLCTDVPAWEVGPALTATDGGTLTVNVRNCLSVPVSIFIPGQLKATSPVTFDNGDGKQRVRSFDVETAAGGSGSYTWTGVKEGTYLYHSGTHPQVQVQMGLYGALTVGNYGIADEATLVYSEIDPALHAAVDDGSYGTTGPTSTFDYLPRYFLINGAAYPGTTNIAVDTGSDVLLRFVNAGLKVHVPTLEGGLYMDLIAEDGNLYPFPLTQYGVELPAAKTIDAVVNVGADGTYAIYDRALNLTNGSATGGGMLTYLVAGAADGQLTAVNDPGTPGDYTIAEDASLTTIASGSPPGVLDNDLDGISGMPPIPVTYEASLVSDVSAGTLTLNPDGSFGYTPDLNFNGTDLFSYQAVDTATTPGPNSNVATVTITVNALNDGPTAVADAYDAIEGQMLSVAAPGVLANDTDPDSGDTLTAGNVAGLTVTVDLDGSATGGPGVVTLNADGSFTHDPTSTGLNASDQVEFDYDACDSALLCSTATVTITVVPAGANIPPFANDDSAETPKNTDLVSFSVTANDVDADGTIDVTTVVITTGATTQRGGVVSQNGDGTVTFEPKKGFRGTDTFKYTVNDNTGDTSNEATVRIKVVK
jgi:FtsP/CotA-like multicopper oxidase with cupredoxin domain